MSTYKEGCHYFLNLLICFKWAFHQFLIWQNSRRSVSFPTTLSQSYTSSPVRAGNSFPLIKPLPVLSVRLTSALHGPVIIFDVFSLSRYHFYQFGHLLGNLISALTMQQPLDFLIWHTFPLSLIVGPQFWLARSLYSLLLPKKDTPSQMYLPI